MKYQDGVLRRAVTLLVTVAAATGFLVVGTPGADAQGTGQAQSSLPAAVPSTATPNIVDGIVYAITKVGNLVIVGGSFTGAQNQGSSTTLPRSQVLAFDATTGALSTTFAPQLDGLVRTLTPGPTPNTVYVGGFFKTVNGVRSKSLTLLDTTTGAIVPAFTPPVLDGAVYTTALAAGHLLVGGSFTVAGSATRNGLMSVNPTTGALDSFLTVGLLQHHNWYPGSTGYANGAVGARAMSVNPAGTRAMVVGNFKTADGLSRDQIVMIDLDGTTAVVDAGWNTLKYTAACHYWQDDTYVTDVQYSPDGSYFVVVTTGGKGTNVDGSRDLCDAAARWNSTDTGDNVSPAWVDYTGGDTFWTVAVTGTAVYAGGHQRWLNNSLKFNVPGPGAVPRPGLVALDPVSGMPLAWNPGRNPRGAGAYAIYASDTGVYVGSDTDYFGNFYYKRQKIGFFPLAGGYTPASTSVNSLPADVYLTGPLSPTTVQQPGGPNDLAYRGLSGSQVGAETVIGGSTIAWGSTRGTFLVGDQLFYGTADGNFYRATFTDTGSAAPTVGAPVTVDPYNDPAWSGVQTGSGQTYQGVRSPYYAQLPNVTGAFYAGGRLYYTLAGKATLFWRWFSPDTGAIGSDENAVPGSYFAAVNGIVASGSTLYWASSTDGALRSMSFVNGVPDPSTTAVVSGPSVDGVDWRARSLFLSGTPVFTDHAPAAQAVSSCTRLTCTFDAHTSGDPDPGDSIASYQWSFGDGTADTGVAPTHSYSAPGTYQVSLQVVDNHGLPSTVWTTQVTVTAAVVPVTLVGATGVNAKAANVSLTVPQGTSLGDTELLFVSTAQAGVTTSLPSGAGWSQVAQVTNGLIETTVFRRSAPDGDAGTAVTLPLASSVKLDARLAVYDGVGTASVTTGSDVKTATHVAPAATVGVDGSWSVEYWSSRSGSAVTWTGPAALTTRGSGTGTGSGQIDALLADTGAGQAAGDYSGQTATTSAVTPQATAITVVLAPVQ